MIMLFSAHNLCILIYAFELMSFSSSLVIIVIIAVILLGGEFTSPNQERFHHYKV